MEAPHVPVLVHEVVESLVHDRTRLVVDGTVGAGGHAEAILEAAPQVRLLGVDRDPAALELAASRLRRFGERVELVEGVFAGIDSLAPAGCDGVLLDLGISSMQIDEPERGFSYSSEGPLDMRMSGDGRSAEALLRETDADELAGMLRELGGVRRPRRVARAIREAVGAGNMRTTADLRRAVEAALGAGATPAELSRVFQAIRIAVNSELDLLASFFSRVLDVVAPGGRIVIISYHSLEDRLVKAFFREESTGCLCPPEVPVCVCGHTPRIRLITRRARKPGKDEIGANPRARSARLRAAEVLDPEVVN